MNSGSRTGAGSSGRFARGANRGSGRPGGSDNSTGLGVHRPYYFFKRNGRTIPANGRWSNSSTRRGRRGKRGAWGSNVNVGGVKPDHLNNSLFNLSSSFLQPPFFAAPDDAELMVKSIAIEIPDECPGWHLYFYKATYEKESELVKQIEVMKNHYHRFLANYDYLEIYKNGYFKIVDKVLNMDEELRKDWPTLITDLQRKPFKTLATIALAMQTLVTASVQENHESVSQIKCSTTHYTPLSPKPRKIYARPVGFIDEHLIEDISRVEIDQLYCVRAVVVSMGSVEMCASWITFRCSRCNQEQALRQQGIRSFNFLIRTIYSNV